MIISINTYNPVEASFYSLCKKEGRLVPRGRRISTTYVLGRAVVCRAVLTSEARVLAIEIPAPGDPFEITLETETAPAGDPMAYEVIYDGQ